MQFKPTQQTVQDNQNPTWEEWNRYHLFRLNRCSKCELHKLSTPSRVVPGLGSQNPLIMIIGEAPGLTEAQRGKPFVGQSGILLQEMLVKLGLTIKDLYVTNVVKHRPPNNRKPLPSEANVCMDNYLDAEIKHVKPKVILCLGRTAAEAIYRLAKKEVPNGSLRGLRFIFEQWPVFCTWHPAHVLRDESRNPDLVEDLKFALGVAQAEIKDAEDEA